MVSYNEFSSTILQLHRLQHRPSRQDTCVQIPCQQDTSSFPVCWTTEESLSAGKIDETFLRFAVEEFQTELHRHWLLGNCIFRQTTGAGNCHLEPSVSKLMKEEREPATIIGCIRHDSPGANGWMNTSSVGTTERCRHKVIWTDSLLKISLLTCNHAAC